MYTYTFYMCIGKHICMYVHIYIYILLMYTYIYIYIYTRPSTRFHWKLACITPTATPTGQPLVYSSAAFGKGVGRCGKAVGLRVP